MKAEAGAVQARSQISKVKILGDREWGAIRPPRPGWMRRGLLLAGNWSTRAARLEPINVPWVQLGYGLSDEEAEAGYRREISPEMLQELKAKGVTMVMLPGWSGLGRLEVERADMEDMIRFAAMARAEGLAVGVYLHCGSFSDNFLDSRPDAADWLAWPAPGKPPERIAFAAADTPAGGNKHRTRYPVYRNHPEYLALLKELVAVAINEYKANLIHFDNWCNGAGWSPRAIQDFGAFLAARHGEDGWRERLGADNLDELAELAQRDGTPAQAEWRFFEAWSLGDALRQLARYIRELNPDVAVEINSSSFTINYPVPVDVSQLLPYVDAFWHEQTEQGWQADSKRFVSSFRSLKLAQRFDASLFSYTPTRLSFCEALAGNVDTVGCPYWFLYGRLNWPPWEPWCYEPSTDLLAPETRFFFEHRELFVERKPYVEVATLRGRATNLAGPRQAAENAYLMEQVLLIGHLPFTILFDQDLIDLARYRAVVLPDVRTLEPRQIDLLLRYVEGGGHLLVTDQTATLDIHGRPDDSGFRRLFGVAPNRAEPGLVVQQGAGRIAYLRTERDAEIEKGSLPRNWRALKEGIEQLMGPSAVQTDAPIHLAMEFYRDERAVRVHLVDYSENPEHPGFSITLSHRLGRPRSARLLAPRREPLALTVTRQADTSTISIPGLDLYGVVDCELDND